MLLYQRRSVIARSYASTGPTSALEKKVPQRSRTIERILRYPNGDERRIYYPIIEEALEEEVLDEEEVQSAWYTAWLTPQARPTEQAPPAAATMIATDDEPSLQQGEDLLTFNWADVKAQAASLSVKVRSTYQVLFGCPWPLPRPMFVLTLSQDQGASHHFYTLPTRVEKSSAVTDELAMVLGSAVMASKFSMSDMEDGVVAFSSRTAAEAYVRDMIAEDTGAFMEVHVCEVTSHELFKLVGEANGCVVAVGFPGGSHTHGDSRGAGDSGSDGVSSSPQEVGWLPAPHQLATALRGHSGWEDML